MIFRKLRTAWLVLRREGAGGMLRVVLEKVLRRLPPPKPDAVWPAEEQMLVRSEENTQEKNMSGIAVPENVEPWMIPVKERIRLVHDARQHGKKIDLMVYERPDSSTFRYRCYNVQQWTEQSSTWQSVYFFRDEIESIYELIACASVIRFVRLMWFREVDTIISEARKHHIPVLYDVDDRVFDLDELPLVTKTISADLDAPGGYEHWFQYIGRNGFTAARVDGYTTTNDYLGSYLEKKFHKPYRVIGNSLNKEQLAISGACTSRRLGADKRDGAGRFVIGYFSGSPTHQHDLGVAAADIARFLEKHEDAVLKVIGFMEFPEVLQAALKRKQIVFEPFTDFIRLQVLMAQVQVNIAPLLDNAFTNCKSELKFFEAAAVNTLTVASPTYAFARCIRDGENGYLCRPGQWYARLEDIYQHFEKQQPLTDQARKDVLAEYAGTNYVRQVEEALNFFATESGDGSFVSIHTAGKD